MSVLLLLLVTKSSYPATDGWDGKARRQRGQRVSGGGRGEGGLGLEEDQNHEHPGLARRVRLLYIFRVPTKIR